MEAEDEMRTGFDSSHRKRSRGKVEHDDDDALVPEMDPETGLPLWSATRMAAIQVKLNQRLGPEFLSQRPGPGGVRKLTYIEGWRVVDLANEIFGFNGWSTSVRSLDVDYLDVHPESGKCNCGVSAIVRITLRDGTFHEDVGYGHAEGVRGKHAALEKCKKEAITDSIKRGLKTFGRVLGNCLYDSHYAQDVLRMPTPARVPLDPANLYRHTPASSSRNPSKQAPSTTARKGKDANACRSTPHARQASAIHAAPPPRQGQQRQQAHQSVTDEQCHNTIPQTSIASHPSIKIDESCADDDDLWQNDNDAEAATMALELELEEDLLLRQSQLARELDGDDHLVDGKYCN